MNKKRHNDATKMMHHSLVFFIDVLFMYEVDKQIITK